MAPTQSPLQPSNPNLQSYTHVPPPVIPGSKPRSESSDQSVKGITSAGGGSGENDGSKPAVVSPATAPKPTANTAKKRKSDAGDAKVDWFPPELDEIDDDDPRLHSSPARTCNAVRKLIRDLVASGAVKVGQFQDAMGVSSRAYGYFMNRTGTWDGDGCDTYLQANLYFAKRELLNLPLKAPTAKKAKTTPESSAKAAHLLDVGDVELPGEGNGSVPVYDTCDEVRKKIRALLAHDGITQAAFTREISKAYPDGKQVSAANLRTFMGKKGPLNGNTNATFYAAYVFFEKRRILTDKPKTKMREEMEQVHGREGVDVVHNSNGFLTLLADETAYIDKYAKQHIHRR